MLGTGLIKGMGETARNFFGSYVDKDRLPTQEYPEVPALPGLGEESRFNAKLVGTARH